MQTLTITPDFRIAIPAVIRDALGLHPGQEIHAVVHNGQIELIPVWSEQELWEFLRGREGMKPAKR